MHRQHDQNTIRILELKSGQEANKHANERIINWPPIWNQLYSDPQLKDSVFPSIVILQNLILNKLKQRIYHTPGNVSVSSKHVLSLSDDGNRVTFPITPAVKGTGSPAVSGSAITQHPVRFQSNSRRQELIEVTLVRNISTNYS